MNKKIELIKALVVLPGTAVGLIPAFIVYATRSFHFLWGVTFPLALLPLVSGFSLVIVGIIFATKTVFLFLTVGDGTPAPWAPPKHFVVCGPYHYVRNPMLLSVLSVLFGAAILCGSFPLLVWCIVFWLINTIYFMCVEEPGLVKRFGAEYQEYKRNVPRWIPRRTPWVQQ